MAHQGDDETAASQRRKSRFLSDACLDWYRRQWQQRQRRNENDDASLLLSSLRVRIMIIMEIVLSWLVCMSCAVYYVLSYLIVETWRMRRIIRHNNRDDDELLTLLSLPLMTESKDFESHGDDDSSIREMYQVLQKLLEKEMITSSTKDDDEEDNQQLVQLIRGNQNIRRRVSRFMLRMHQCQQQQTPPSSSSVCYIMYYQRLKRIWPQLLKLPHLVRLSETTQSTSPTIDDSSTTTTTPSGTPCSCQDHNDDDDHTGREQYRLALIVPAYKESGHALRRTLQVALDHCQNPQQVVVVVVNAGHCTDLQVLKEASFAASSSSSSSLSSCCCCQDDKQTNAATNGVGEEHDDTTSFIAVSSSGSSSSSFGAFALIPYRDKQQICAAGRGPTLNYGAEWVQSHFLSSKAHHTTTTTTTSAAAGIQSRRCPPLILTFLHADTLLPRDWDTYVQKALVVRQDDDKKKKVVQACAFRFGHDLSRQGLSSSSSSSASGDSHDDYYYSYPWGIRAVQWLGNLRAEWAALPYGDHVISMPAIYFNYLGGFPHQPIMEDYELMDLLRKRARTLNNAHNVEQEQESIAILPAQAQCSPRRWQKHGVVYTTLVNALIVHRYSRRDNPWTASDIFDYYYNNSSGNENDNQQEIDQQQESTLSGRTSSSGLLSKKHA